MRYRLPRGTQDVLPDEQPYWRHVAATAEGLAARFGFRRIETPVFEQTGLFERGVGLGTDIVEKEMYTFRDRGDELLTLRPEGTAPVCRAYLEHGMAALPQPVRLHYLCPIFRYERPQAGRLRQHHQFGVEAIGDGDPAVDAEVIDLGWRLTAELGLGGLSLLVNSIGCRECRPGYLDALKSAYGPRLADACPDCQVRYQKNPLRMLDCKRTDYGCQGLAHAAPRSADHLCAPCADHWSALLRYLGALGIPYQVSARLVRGLDYYTRTVFEVQPPEEGAQSTILGGGRYDGLMEQLGGRPTPGVGFGAGMERLALNVRRQGVGVAGDGGVDAVVVSLGAEATEEAVRLASRLRAEGLRVVAASPGRSLKGQMRYAAAVGARYAVVIGEAEMARGAVQVKELASGIQREVPRAQAALELAR